jgi:hypothetical protein
VEVKNKGGLDLSGGGTLDVNGKFTFDSNVDHHKYLTDGIIIVRGDTEIKSSGSKFFCSAKNVFEVASRAIAGETTEQTRKFVVKNMESGFEELSFGISTDFINFDDALKDPENMFPVKTARFVLPSERYKNTLEEYGFIFPKQTAGTWNGESMKTVTNRAQSGLLWILQNKLKGVDLSDYAQFSFGLDHIEDGVYEGYETDKLGHIVKYKVTATGAFINFGGAPVGSGLATYSVGTSTPLNFGFTSSQANIKNTVEDFQGQANKALKDSVEKLTKEAFAAPFSDLLTSRLLGLANNNGGNLASRIVTITGQENAPKAISAVTKFGLGKLNKKLIQKLKIACPVDVSVYDSSNKIVGQITNNAVTLYDPDGAAFLWVNGDEKVVTYPSGEGYNFVLTATDDGKMTVTITDCDDSLAALAETSFNNVPLYKNGVITVANLDNTSKKDYVLERKDENGSTTETIEPDANGNKSTTEPSNNDANGNTNTAGTTDSSAKGGANGSGAMPGSDITGNNPNTNAEGGYRAPSRGGSSGSPTTGADSSTSRPNKGAMTESEVNKIIDDAIDKKLSSAWLDIANCPGFSVSADRLRKAAKADKPIVMKNEAYAATLTPSLIKGLNLSGTVKVSASL